MEKNLIFLYILLIVIEIVIYASYLIYSHYKEKRDEERLEQLERLQAHHPPLAFNQNLPFLMGYRAIEPVQTEEVIRHHLINNPRIANKLVPIHEQTLLKPKYKFDLIAEKLDKLIELQQQQQKAKDSPISPASNDVVTPEAN